MGDHYHSRRSGRCSRHRDRRGAGRLRRQKKDGRQRSALKYIEYLLASVLDLREVGSKFTRPARRTAAASIDRYLLPAPVLSSKPTDERPPPLLL